MLRSDCARCHGTGWCACFCGDPGCRETICPCTESWPLGLRPLMLTYEEAAELDAIMARPSPLIGKTLRRANEI